MVELKQQLDERNAAHGAGKPTGRYKYKVNATYEHIKTIVKELKNVCTEYKEDELGWCMWSEKLSQDVRIKRTKEFLKLKHDFEAIEEIVKAGVDTGAVVLDQMKQSGAHQVRKYGVDEQTGEQIFLGEQEDTEGKNAEQLYMLTKRRMQQ